MVHITKCNEFKISDYQKSILNEIHNSNNNILVDAKAGSGKTSTLLLIAEELMKQNKKALFLAFNKSVVEELSKKLTNKEYCCIKTLHSVGYSFVLSYLYKKYGKDNYVVSVNEDIVKEIISFYFKEYALENVMLKYKENDSEEDSFTDFCKNLQNEILQLVNFVRFYLIDYTDLTAIEEFVDRKLCNCFYLYEPERYGITTYPLIVKETILKIIERFNNPELNEENKYIFNISYTDMLFLPLYFNMYVPYSLQPYLDNVEVDESQDLSLLQQALLAKLRNYKNTTRYIFVGDKYQAIYGFAGADSHSIERLKDKFNAKTLPLNICYRCPQKIIQLSQDIVPTIEWNKDREDKGIVKILEKQDIYSMLKDKDIIIGRYNSTLLYVFRNAVLEKKIQIKFKNNEIVNSIYNEFCRVTKEYIRRYNNGENIEVDLLKFLKQKEIPLIKNSRNTSQQKIVNDYTNNLIQTNLKTAKAIIKRKYTLDYLLIAMQEYLLKGKVNILEENSLENQSLDEYCNIIFSFIYEYLISIYGIQREGEFNLNDYITQLKQNSLNDFFEFINNFLHCNDNKENAPILSTVHMMKGGEGDRVFILDYPLFPYIQRCITNEQMQQEENLQYVAITRAKKELYLIKVQRDEVTTKTVNVDEYNELAEMRLIDKFGKSCLTKSKEIEYNVNEKSNKKILTRPPTFMELADDFNEENIRRNMV